MFCQILFIDKLIGTIGAQPPPFPPPNYPQNPAAPPQVSLVLLLIFKYE